MGTRLRDTWSSHLPSLVKPDRGSLGTVLPWNPPANVNAHRAIRLLQLPATIHNRRGSNHECGCTVPDDAVAQERRSKPHIINPDRGSLMGNPHRNPGPIIPNHHGLGNGLGNGAIPVHVPLRKLRKHSRILSLPTCNPTCRTANLRNVAMVKMGIKGNIALVAVSFLIGTGLFYIFMVNPGLAVPFTGANLLLPVSGLETLYMFYLGTGLMFGSTGAIWNAMVYALYFEDGRTRRAVHTVLLDANNTNLLPASIRRVRTLAMEVNTQQPPLF